MRLNAVILAASLLAAGAANAQTPVCGQPYTVGRGDTLQKIVNQVYSPDDSYMVLYRANRDVIGRDPSLLEVGMVLRIPCRDEFAEGVLAPLPALAPVQEEEEALAEVEPPAPEPVETTPVAAEPAETAPIIAAPEPAPKAEPETPARPLRILAASGWAPFLDEQMEGGGMLAQILRAALSKVMAEDGFRIDFINDRSAHLRPLLADHAYDLSIAWLRPDCAAPAGLSPESAARCKELAWSDPLFEQVIGYYMRRADKAPQSIADLAGRKLCRAESFSTHMLDAGGLTSATTRVIRPAKTETCFAMLLNGEVDAVIAETPVAEAAIVKFSALGEVQEHPQLATAETLHAITAADNPQKDALLAKVNEGLAALRRDGALDEIVRNALIAHARRVAEMR